MQTKDDVRRDVLTFLLVLTVLSAGLFVLFFTYGRSVTLIFAMTWSPGIAAIVTRVVHRSGVRDFGWRWGAPAFKSRRSHCPCCFACSSTVSPG